MENFAYKTRNNEDPQGKQRVYFTCALGDHDKYFDDISYDILKVHDCVLFFKESQEDYLCSNEELKDMRLFVIPVTKKLLTLPNRAMDEDVPFAIDHNIPILPLMQENGLEELFNAKFGNIHFINKSKFESKEDYCEVLRKYISSILIGDELVEEIRSAFDAYIFLSYRKEDHKYARELMRLIHQNSFCRDVAIWYDDFLVPGENFNVAIENVLRKCELFALVVTPNLIDKENYVMDIEYPKANQFAKAVIPVEFCSTDTEKLRILYKNIPDCIDSQNVGLLRDTLQYALRNITLRRNDNDPKHNFLIGLAYLNGIDTDVNEKVAENLLLLSAKQGYLDGARKMAELYSKGIFLAKDEVKAIYWFEVYYSKTKDKYLQKNGADIPDLDDVMNSKSLDEPIAKSVQRIHHDITTYFSLISLYEKRKCYNAEICSRMAKICCILFEKHYGRGKSICIFETTYRTISGYEIYVDENGKKKIGNAIYKDKKEYSVSAPIYDPSVFYITDKLITSSAFSIDKETRRQLVLFVIDFIKKNMDRYHIYLNKYHDLLEE